MIFQTKNEVNAYIWNTSEEMLLEKQTKFSDYTSLEEEVGKESINKTLERVKQKNVTSFKEPKLMTVVSGFAMGCRVWVESEELVKLDEYDPKEEPDYYSE